MSLVPKNGFILLLGRQCDLAVIAANARQSGSQFELSLFYAGHTSLPFRQGALHMVQVVIFGPI